MTKVPVEIFALLACYPA